MKCIVCGGSDFTIIHHGTRDHEDINVMKCSQCGQVRLSAFGQIQDGFYESSGMRSIEQINRLAADETVKNDIRRAAYFVNDYAGKDILDFGCGGGGYLRLADNYAKNVCGVELEDTVRNVLLDSGIDVKKDIREFDKNFDFVTMFHVIEHLADPFCYLGMIREHLKENGRLVIETPNADDALLTLYGCEEFRKFSYWGCHVQLYTSCTLETVLKKAGFKIIWSRQIQRYPLANHLYWLGKGKPAGHKIWKEISSDILNKEYERVLEENGLCDTLLIAAEKENNGGNSE